MRTKEEIQKLNKSVIDAWDKRQVNRFAVYDLHGQMYALEYVLETDNLKEDILKKINDKKTWYMDGVEIIRIDDLKQILNELLG